MKRKILTFTIIGVLIVNTLSGCGLVSLFNSEATETESQTQDAPPSEKDTTTEKDTVDSSTEGTETEKESVSETTETEVETETETESPEPTESESESETETEIETETETESEPETETEVETETEIETEPTPEPEPHTHAYTLTKTNKATCTKDGSYVYSCSCGDSYSENIKKTGHSYGAYVYNNDATYSKDGTETATCANCGGKTSRTVSGTKLSYTYTDVTPYTMYAQKTVNVRSLPSTDGSKLGSLSKGDAVTVTGYCNETGWYRIDFNGKTGYASSSYLDTKLPAGYYPSLEDDSWKVYYTEDDVVGDGLDAYRVGLLKYAADGTQLYVYTNHSDREKMNGFYCTYDEYYSEKGEAFEEAFEEWCVDNGYTFSRSSFFTYDLGEANDHAYRMRAYYAAFHPDLTSTGVEEVIYNWEDYRIIKKCNLILYEIENPDDLAWYTKTREEVLESNGWTEADLENAKKLALTYNIDFHYYYE